MLTPPLTFVQNEHKPFLIYKKQIHVQINGKATGSRMAKLALSICFKMKMVELINF